jgi:hypothetical protein
MPRRDILTRDNVSWFCHNFREPADFRMPLLWPSGMRARISLIRIAPRPASIHHFPRPTSDSWQPDARRGMPSQPNLSIL